MAAKRKPNQAEPYAKIAEADGAKVMTLHVGLETFGPVPVGKDPFAIGDAKIKLVELAKQAGIEVWSVPLASG